MRDCLIVRVSSARLEHLVILILWFPTDAPPCQSHSIAACSGVWITNTTYSGTSLTKTSNAEAILATLPIMQSLETRRLAVCETSVEILMVQSKLGLSPNDPSEAAPNAHCHALIQSLKVMRLAVATGCWLEF